MCCKIKEFNLLWPALAFRQSVVGSPFWPIIATAIDRYRMTNLQVSLLTIWKIHVNTGLVPKANSECSQTFKMELCGKLFTVFVKSFI